MFGKPKSPKPKKRRKDRRFLIVELNDIEKAKLDALVARRGPRGTIADTVREWLMTAE